jgi:DNA-binding NarL/FixJ family response regulator
VRRVLITDDHAVARLGIAAVLAEGLGPLEVGHAATPDATRLLLGAEPWDLLVLDLDLGGRSGLDLLAAVRRGWPSLPVLAMGPEAAADEALAALRLGALGWLPTSATSAELTGAARAVLAGRAHVPPALAGPLLHGAGRAAPGEPPRLSARERQVVRLVAGGRTAREAAQTLGVSAKTVATYRARLAAKLGLTTAVELTRFAHQHGML